MTAWAKDVFDFSDDEWKKLEKMLPFLYESQTQWFLCL